MHQKVEEEALMQVLEQVVEAPKGALNDPAHGHFVMPAIPVWL